MVRAIITLVVMLVVLTFAACGGPESEPPTPAPAMLSPEPALPTEAEAANLQEYLDAACQVNEDDIETHGEAVVVFQEGVERLTKHRPPEELRNYTDAVVRWAGLILEDLEDRDSGEAFGGYQTFTEGPFQETWDAVSEAQRAMDPDLARAVQDAGC